MAVFGQERDSEPHRLPRRPGTDNPAVDLDLAPIGRRDPKKHLGDLRATGADEAEEAEDLARSNVEADIPDEAGTGESPYTDHRLPYLRILLREKGSGLSTDHVTNDLFRRESGGGRRDDTLPRAQDRHVIAQSKDLIDEVTDEKNGHALLLQIFNDLEEAIDLAARDGRGGFVHDKHPRVDRQSFGDLNGLTFGDTQHLDRQTNVKIDAQA